MQNLAETHSKKDFEIDSFISAIRFFEKSLQREIKFDKKKIPFFGQDFFYYPILLSKCAKYDKINHTDEVYY